MLGSSGETRGLHTTCLVFFVMFQM
jgi:hypothetical protein